LRHLGVFSGSNKMADNATTVAYNFYEHKDTEKLLAEGLAANVSVSLVDSKEGQKTYDVGGEWTAVLFTPVGKKAAVTIRPILKA
jgi:hypothetical protein